MNLSIIIISILLSVICILLAFIQHIYFSTVHNKTKPKEIPAFEDLIPSGDTINNFEIGLPINEFTSDDDDFVLNDLSSILSQPKKLRDHVNLNIKMSRASGTETEIYNTLQAAIAFKLAGKTHRAKKLFDHAAAIAPQNPDVLNKYGEFMEQTHNDVITADELYFKALTHSPEHTAALMNHQRTVEVIENLDHKVFKVIDERNDYLKNQIKLDAFEAVKKQAYYLHIYHTVGIEGNTMTVEQLRYLLETGQVVSGKSIVEHNEILGLEKAMQYIKLLIREDYIGVKEILGIHRRVMGHVDPIKSGVFRKEKVFVGSHIPPPHEDIPALMDGYVEWLNSAEAQSMHPVRYAALAHYKLVDIHPFVDGNGRTSRLIMNLILLKAGYPPVMILKEQREKYYDALKTANMGDVRPFVRFIAQCTLQILDMYIYGTKFLSIAGVSDKHNEIMNYELKN